MDTKRKIISTALHSFIRQGYDKTSLNSIAAELGITKGAVYHHFTNKKALFDEALTQVFRDLEVWFYQGVMNTPDFRTMLRNYINFTSYFQTTSLFEKQDLDGNLYKLMFDAADSVDGFRAKISQSYKSYIDIVRTKALEAQKNGEIRSDIDCEILAISLTTMVEGMLLFNSFSPQLKLDDRVDEVFSLIWKMIGTA
ncbi:MAG: TetR/AcrR family transcriptional regulator [Spirochaetota bacterium]